MNALLIKEYFLANGVSPYIHWLKSLDRSHRARVDTRIRRFSIGQLGENRHLGGGLHEAKLDFGPGYRVYFGLRGKELILLLCGGDKSSQASDIKKAQLYWLDFQRESS